MVFKKIQSLFLTTNSAERDKIYKQNSCANDYNIIRIIYTIYANPFLMEIHVQNIEIHRESRKQKVLLVLTFYFFCYISRISQEGVSRKIYIK